MKKVLRESASYIVFVALLIVAVILLCMVVISVAFYSFNQTRYTHALNNAALAGIEKFSRDQTTSDFSGKAALAKNNANAQLSSYSLLSMSSVSGLANLDFANQSEGWSAHGIWFGEWKVQDDDNNPLSESPCSSRHPNYPCFIEAPSPAAADPGNFPRVNAMRIVAQGPS